MLSASSQSPDPPALWIIGGPNGSGKTTAYSETSIEGPLGSVWIINPDKLAKTISEHEGLPLNPEANLEAVKRIEAWLYASVRAHQTVGVETVLSTDKFRPLVAEAKKRGFLIRFVYIFLRDADLNVERVKLRVAKGGHDVSEDKIRDRRDKSLRQMGWFLAQANQALVFDNSGAKSQLVIEKTGNGAITILGDLIPEMAASLVEHVPDFPPLRA